MTEKNTIIYLKEKAHSETKDRNIKRIPQDLN